MQKASQSPLVLHKALYRGGFLKFLVAFHIEGLHKAPRGFVHIYRYTNTYLVLVFNRYGGCFMKHLYRGTFAKSLYKWGFVKLLECLENVHTHNCTI